MADAIPVRAAKAVTATIIAAPAGTFALKFTPERSYADWQEALKKLNTLKVDVVQISPVPTELETRGFIQYQPAVDVVVRKRFGEGSQQPSTGRIKIEDIDQLVLLVQQLSEITTGEHVGDDVAVWESTDILASYKPSHIRLYRQFTGIVRIKYKAQVELAR